MLSNLEELGEKIISEIRVLRPIEQAADIYR